MNGSIHSAHENDRVSELITEVDAQGLASDLGGANENPSSQANVVSGLRVAAFLALAEALALSTDQLLRRMTSSDGLVDTHEDRRTFEKWDAYVAGMVAEGQSPSIDDLVFYSAAGLRARQQVEVRSALRPVGVTLPDVNSSRSANWDSHVREEVNTALLLMVRQRSRTDISECGQVIGTLVSRQAEAEALWLESRANPAEDALTLLGYYHIARAVSRTSEFLLAGSVVSAEAEITDVGPELRRLLSRAGECLSGDLDAQFWLNAVSVILWTLRSDSIWISGRGISQRLDQLLLELATGERERAVFSLLPSQQDAIRQSVLDPSRIAVVLQMPTSSGKTLLSEFAILQTVDAFKDNVRVVYIVPTRALATQTLRTLAEDLVPLGIDVVAAASAFEEDPYEVELLRGSEGVVIATPEKLDLLLRSHPEWFANLRLVVVDEAHLLRESERGARLELLLANLRRERPDARFLLMTPFVDNAKEIAGWLGGARGLPIAVQWRPMRLLLGVAEVEGQRKTTSFMTEWTEPHRHGNPTVRVRIPAGVSKTSLNSTKNRVVAMARKLWGVGSILALYSGSKRGPENVALEISDSLPRLESSRITPALRVAIALASDELGPDSVLARCLERGAAYHHAALSPTLRYLIEDQIRAGVVHFVAATTTLAQGMNFPVASVIVHSVHRPWGGGNLSPSEFWNIAGRAGRVGWSDRGLGLVVFVGNGGKNHWEHYSSQMQAEVRSALLDVMVEVGVSGVALKELYRKHVELRPFLQYLAHAAASTSPQHALDDLEELLHASLANAQASSGPEEAALRSVARRYLQELTGRGTGLLKVADRTGLGSFSFDELYAKIRNNDVLSEGPSEVVQRKEAGMKELVDALRWLPELDLAIGYGPGGMNVEAVARVVQGWIDGRSIVELSDAFPGEEPEDQVRKAATYIFSTVSQTVSWGAHAYLRGWGLSQPENSSWQESEGAMLPAFIQHGVKTPEAAVVSLLNVPRQVAEPIASLYREHHGSLVPGEANQLRDFVEAAGDDMWRAALQKVPLETTPADLRAVWRQMRGLPQ